MMKPLVYFCLILVHVLNVHTLALTVPSRTSIRIKNTVTTSVASNTHLEAVPSTLIWTASHVVAGSAGAVFVIPATKPGGWYRNISLPTWTPPDRIFAPVWTTLYSMMGISVARIHNLVGIKSIPVLLWLFHLSMNLLWAPVFFKKQMLRTGQAINITLLTTLAMIIPQFYALDKASAILLLPYMCWATFATFLNGNICKRNPTDKYGYNNAKFQAGLIQLQQKASEYAFS